ncbi:MAG: DUF1330 domain-containing protein [Solirubrobacterales bacterium]|nr:DUF1330 domain-containing protein [Solirubrobacterales bacterium]
MQGKHLPLIDPLNPTEAQIASLTDSEDDSPIVMVNLLRFKDQADGIDEGRSGAEAYGIYGQKIASYLEEVGGKVLLAVACEDSIIGPEEAEWDMVILVQYPSRKAFLKMITDPGYLKEHEHRVSGLAETRLILSKLAFGGDA